MDISELGEFKLIDLITSDFSINRSSTIKGIGDDCAVLNINEKSYMLISTDLLLEGIHFDLTYFPLKHLGYKSVVVAMSDICAMNGTPTRLMVSIGVSARYNTENIKEIYDGINIACKEYDIELIGGDTSSSKTGLTLSMTAIGEVEKDSVTYRSGAKETDLICVTGDLGAAYMGLKLLDREKRVLEGNSVSKPKFDGYEYLIERELKPYLRLDVIKELKKAGIIPTSMIDISDGLASEIKHISKASDVGARIYLERIPISSKTFALAEEMNIDPVVAALNGGDDYELLFTIPVSMHEQITKIGGIDIIGHITHKDTGVMLTTPDGSDITLQAQGWK